MSVLDRTCALEITRWFAAAPERLFDAWLEESCGEWLAPQGVFCTSSIVNPKVGGRFAVAMKMPDGREVTVSGTYREIARPARLAFTWSGGCTGEETLITLTFRARDGGTEMTLVQEGFASPETRDRHDQGWNGGNGVFDKLTRFLAD